MRGLGIGLPWSDLEVSGTGHSVWRLASWSGESVYLSAHLSVFWPARSMPKATTRHSLRKYCPSINSATRWAGTGRCRSFCNSATVTAFHCRRTLDLSMPYLRRFPQMKPGQARWSIRHRRSIAVPRPGPALWPPASSCHRPARSVPVGRGY